METRCRYKARLRLSALLLILCLVALFEASPGHAQAGGPVYTVQPGDTLSDIAYAFGTTVPALVAANGIDDASLVYAGMQLIIPGLEGISGELEIQTFAFGDVLDSLAALHGTSAEALVKLNRVTNPSRIYAGQPFIMTVDEETASALSMPKYVLPAQDECWLEMAVREGLNPWLLAGYGPRAGETWLVPGVPQAIPGGEDASRGLPEPLVSVDVTPVTAVQGRTEVIRVETSSPQRGEGSLADGRLYFGEIDPLHLVALQGIGAMAEPGLYDLEVRLYDEASGELTYAIAQPIRVRSGRYQRDPVLYVPPETINPETIRQENELLASIRGAASPDRYWDGAFAYPSRRTSAFPSVFGSRRNYNNTGYTTYHAGLDFYGAKGEAIRAPAPGRVVFTGPLAVRGKTTIIDHGWGVFTAYLHQSKFLVAEGDTVATGQKIGLVGGTGRATGPHLHWEVSVGGVPVNPLEWVQKVFP